MVEEIYFGTYYGHSVRTSQGFKKDHPQIMLATKGGRGGSENADNNGPREEGDQANADNI